MNSSALIVGDGYLGGRLCGELDYALCPWWEPLPIFL